jgi:hypothetical protein
MRLRVAPAPRFASGEAQFLYGSIGSEAHRGIPYWIWLVLPRVFPQYLSGPGGYASIGIFARDGGEMPIGFSKTEIGVPRVGVNCAFCHTATVRATAADVPMVFPGAPSSSVGAQEYLRFLVAAASDPRFSALFGPGSLGEAPLAATLTDGRVIAGTVDRLLVEDGRVSVIDFKTGRVPAGEVDIPNTHRAQMAAYVEALRVIFPGRQVSASLLYTAGPKLIEVP